MEILRGGRGQTNAILGNTKSFLGNKLIFISGEQGNMYSYPHGRASYRKLLE